MTTPAPSTTPVSTFPTPLPYDPDKLLTSVVFLEMTQYSTPADTRSAQARLFKILEMYAESENMVPQNFSPEFE